MGKLEQYDREGIDKCCSSLVRLISLENNGELTDARGGVRTLEEKNGKGERDGDGADRQKVLEIEVIAVGTQNDRGN